MSITSLRDSLIKLIELFIPDDGNVQIGSDIDIARLSQSQRFLWSMMRERLFDLRRKWFEQREQDRLEREEEDESPLVSVRISAQKTIFYNASYRST